MFTFCCLSPVLVVHEVCSEEETSGLQVQDTVRQAHRGQPGTVIIFTMDQKETTLIEIIGQMGIVFHEDSKNTTLQLY